MVPTVFSREGEGGGWGGALVGLPGGSIRLLGARCHGLASQEVTVVSAALAGRPQTEKDPPAWGQGPDPPAQSGAGGAGQGQGGAFLGWGCVALQGPRSRVLQPRQEG